MVSALMMLRRVSMAFRYAVREDDFLNVFGAGVLLVVIGTVTYSLSRRRASPIRTSCFRTAG